MENLEKSRIGLLFGGKTQERSISCISAQAIWQQIDRSLYDAVAIGWAPNGDFHASDDILKLISDPNDPRRAEIISSSDPVDLKNLSLDLVFPVTHGVGGEDGVLQGYLESLGIDYVGARVLGSSLSFHKGICKQLLKQHGIPVVPWIDLTRGQAFPGSDNIKFPVFVKPAASGSSLGVHKVNVVEELPEAMEDAWVECRDILIEVGLEARELECAYLLGEASGVGEIKPRNEFYDWNAKYVDEDGAEIILEADIPDNIKEQIRELSIKTCRILKIDDYARVDFFYNEKEGQIYVNEVNTLPDFTSISMFPKLWEAQGLSFKDLISRLIQKHIPLMRAQ